MQSWWVSIQCSTGPTESQGSQGQILNGCGKLLVSYYASNLLPVVQIVMQTFRVGLDRHPQPPTMNQ